MIRIKPFIGYRPNYSLVEKVAALPYDVVSDEEARNLIKDNPYSFLNIDKHELNVKENQTKDMVYKGAEEYLKRFIKDKILIHDTEKSIYIYGIETELGVHYGIITCLHCEDYSIGRIKRHEKVREEKRKDRMAYINLCNYQTAPIMLIHQENYKVQKWIFNNVNNNKPLYNFKDENDMSHTIFKISDKSEVRYITNLFKEIEVLYLADGHHRTDSLEKYAKIKKQNDPAYSTDKGYNYLLGVIFGQEQVLIRSYNRVIKDISGLSENEIFNKLCEKFIIKQRDELEYVPNNKNIIGMRYNKKWYQLELKEEEKNKLNTVQSLDVNILQEFILNPIFKITDPTIDSNIEFIGGDKGVKELNRMTEKDMDIAFSLFATDMNDFINIINSGELMPPKSTWFEPKIRRGLFVYEMN
ncbi:DUF1015 domain-containing protein [Clostridium tertium]